MPGQRIGGRRLIISKSARQTAVAGEAVSAHLHIADLRASALGLPRAVDALAAAETQLGKGYALYGCRCEEVCGKRDCSGLIYYGINHVSGTHLCGSSFGLAQVGSQAGTLITEEEAIWTPAALGIRCGFCSPNAIGSNGHVVYMKGDGRSTVEEGGHATGCYRGQATGRGFDTWMLYPGLDYSLRAKQETDMIIQRLDGKGKPKAGKPAGRKPVVGVSEDGLFVAEWNGASISGDLHKDGDPANLRRWYPRGADGHDALTGGFYWQGVAPHADDRGITAVRSDGATFAGNFS